MEYYRDDMTQSFLTECLRFAYRKIKIVWDTASDKKSPQEAINEYGKKIVLLSNLSASQFREMGDEWKEKVPTIMDLFHRAYVRYLKIAYAHDPQGNRNVVLASVEYPRLADFLSELFYNTVSLPSVLTGQVLTDELVLRKAMEDAVRDAMRAISSDRVRITTSGDDAKSKVSTSKPSKIVVHESVSSIFNKQVTRVPFQTPKSSVVQPSHVKTLADDEDLTAERKSYSKSRKSTKTSSKILPAPSKVIEDDTVEEPPMLAAPSHLSETPTRISLRLDERKASKVTAAPST
jgi:hypothetical protein